MSSKNSKLPGHAWKTVGRVDVDNGSHFQYACTKCPAKTLNGVPLEKPYDEECRN